MVEIMEPRIRTGKQKGLSVKMNKDQQFEVVFTEPDSQYWSQRDYNRLLRALHVEYGRYRRWSNVRTKRQVKEQVEQAKVNESLERTNDE